MQYFLILFLQHWLNTAPKVLAARGNLSPELPEDVSINITRFLSSSMLGRTT